MYILMRRGGGVMSFVDHLRALVDDPMQSADRSTLCMVMVVVITVGRRVCGL